MVSYGISANLVTYVGFIFGFLAIFFVTQEFYTIAAGFIGLNRLFDGLDGSVARQSKLTDFGGFLDIVCDFIIYAGIVFAFAFVVPENSFYAAFLLFSFIGPITSFLAYAIMAAKRKKESTKRGKKSFYYLGGLCEGTETAFFLILMCIFPDYFPLICVVFGVLCWLTTFGRVYLSYNDFSD